MRHIHRRTVTHTPGDTTQVWLDGLSAFLAITAGALRAADWTPDRAKLHHHLDAPLHYSWPLLAQSMLESGHYTLAQVCRELGLDEVPWVHDAVRIEELPDVVRDGLMGVARAQVHREMEAKTPTPQE